MSTTLRVGAATVVMTPPLGMLMGGYISRDSRATGVLDELTCRVVVLQAGSTTLVIVAIDLLYVPKALSTLVADGIASRLLVTRSEVMVCATHTHCGPGVGSTHENESLYKRIAAAAASGAARAATEVTDARLVRNLFPLTGLTRNRRNPEADVEQAGTVLAAVALSGEVIATLVGLACHPTVLEGDTTWYSRDYPGALCDTIEQICGGTAVFLQGFAGDVNPVFHDHSARDMRLFGAQLGASASSALLAGLRDSQPAFTINLSKDAVLPLPVISSARVLRVDRLSAILVDVDVEPAVQPGPAEARRSLEAAYEAERNARSDLERERAVAIRQACWIDDLLASRSPVLGVDYPPLEAATLPVQVFQLGDEQRIIALPGEPLTATARRMREVLGDDALLVGYANAAASYLPPEEAFDEYGYEIGSTRYAKGTVERLSETANRLARIRPGGGG